MTKIVDTFQLPFGRETIGNRFGIHDIVDGHDLYGPQGHRGVDFKVAHGTAVPVIAHGEIQHVFHSAILGNIVVVRHYLPGNQKDVYSGYCHLNTSLVNEGKTVNRGDIIAKSGDTGSACYGPHLHMTLSGFNMGVVEGEVRDPIAFIDHYRPNPAPVSFHPKFTAARRGEGLIRIAERSSITFTQIKRLNPSITAPDYIVMLGQQVRIA